MQAYLFAFEDPAHAKRFVERLVLNLKHLAIFRDDVHVSVFDGSDEGQRERILQLARASSAALKAAK